MRWAKDDTYGGVLARFGSAALECDPVALVLQALGSDQALDARSLGVWLRALLLGLDLTTNDEFADLHMSRSAMMVSDSTEADMRQSAGEEE